jgi:membrane protein
MRRVRSIGKVIKESLSEFAYDRVMKLSAALAYYTVFSLPPMLMVIISLCSIFYGREAVQGQLFFQIREFVGEASALQIQEVLTKTTLFHDGAVGTIIGFVTLLLGATGIFGEIQDSINMIWGLKTKPKKGFIKMLLNRLWSFSMVLALGFVLLVSLVINAVLSSFSDYLSSLISTDLVNVFMVLNHLITFGVITSLFAVILKVLPDARILWRDVYVGAVVTALLFMLGKLLIGFYLSKNATISAYGAASSIIVLLLWVYYSSIILYFGAEFTQVYVRMRGRKIEPNRYAVWIEKVDVEKHWNTEKIDKKAVPHVEEKNTLKTQS